MSIAQAIQRWLLADGLDADGVYWPTSLRGFQGQYERTREAFVRNGGVEGTPEKYMHIDGALWRLDSAGRPIERCGP